MLYIGYSFLWGENFYTKVFLRPEKVLFVSPYLPLVEELDTHLATTSHC